MGDFAFRPNESIQIRWKNVSTFTTKEGNEIMEVEVSPTTKTWSREVHADRVSVEYFFERVKSLAGFSSPDDFVFCDQDESQLSEGVFLKLSKSY